MDARASQGAINQPQESVEQQFGDRETTETGGGDAAGRDIYKLTMLNYFASGDVDKSMADPKFKALLALLDQIDNQDSVPQARQASLPDDANLFLNEATDNATILTQLHEEYGKIPAFITHLIQDEAVPQQVRNQLKAELEACITSSEADQPSHQLPDDSSTDQKLTPYMMVVLRPTSNDGQFLVNAWLIPDDTDSTSLDRFKPLDLDDDQKGKDCTLAEIPGVIDQFLSKSRQYLRGQKCHPITLEVFFPLEYLCSEAEHWEISVRNKTLPIGVKHPLIVRSYERLCFDYLDDCWTDWCDNWEQFKTHLNNTPSHELFEKLEKIDEGNWDEILYNFKDQPEKVGFIIPCLPCEDMQEDLFNTIIDASAPFALWVRRTIPDFDHITEFTELLSHGPLGNLPERIRKLRERARAQRKVIDEHYAYHLSILWEDPNRLTPDVMIQLQSPG